MPEWLAFAGAVVVVTFGLACVLGLVLGLVAQWLSDETDRWRPDE